MLALNTNTFRSLEFMLVVVTNLAMWTAAVASSGVGYNSATYWTAGSAGLYALARSLAKFNTDSRPFYLTTEFWMAVAGAAVTSVSGLNSTISPHTYGLLMAALSALLAVGNGLRKAPASQIPLTDPPTAYDAAYRAEAED